MKDTKKIAAPPPPSSATKQGLAANIKALQCKPTGLNPYNLMAKPQVKK